MERESFPRAAGFFRTGAHHSCQRQCLFRHHRNGLRMEPAATALCADQNTRLGWISQLVEERGGHLRAARIPNTREADHLHDERARYGNCFDGTLRHGQFVRVIVPGNWRDP